MKTTQRYLKFGGALTGREDSTSPPADERSPSPIGWERARVRVDWAFLEVENTKASHPNPLPSEGRGTRSARRAFTMIEMIAVLTVLAILAAILVPALI